MKFRYPKYYESFQCIADRCEDTCCAGWEIDIDDASYEYYMSVEGEFGKRLRENIKEYESDGEDVYEQHGFILKEDRRCPFLDEHNLCDLYRELGEDALCDVCTDTPRNYLEYAGAREVSLSTSCAEAGRLLYGTDAPIVFVEKEIDETLGFEESEEEILLGEQIRLARDESISILQNRKLPLETRVVHFLNYAKQVQDCLNEDDVERISKIEKVAFYDNSTDVDGMCDPSFFYQSFLKRLRSYSELESVNEEWEQVLLLLQNRYVEPEDAKGKYIDEQRTLWEKLKSDGRIYEYEHMLVYYSFLCLARCVDDYDFLAKAKMVVASFLMIRDMDCVCFAEGNRQYTKEDRVRLARIYAKEVEHSGENLEYLADEFLFEDAYSVENLCLALTFM